MWLGAVTFDYGIWSRSGGLILQMPAVRILLIDDHALFRSGLRLVLQAGIADVEVLDAASLEQAVRLGGSPPSLVLLDLQLQGVNGLEGIGLLRQRWPGVPLVILSSTAEPETVRLALSRGAAAFVSKADTAEKIIQLIGQLLANAACGIGGAALPQAANTAADRPRLTPRQCEVLDLLCEGLSNKVIARRLELSEFTVRGHVQAVLGLLGISSRSQVTYAARRSGLIG